MREKVAVAVSGGVDSAVAVALLKEQGHEVIGVHLRFCDVSPQCGGGEAEKSARDVAKHLEIPLIIWDLKRIFKKKVIDHFFEEYRKGRTPVPCAVCNREIKFGVFLEKALEELKVDKVAMGHYARRRRELPITNYQFPNKSKITSEVAPDDSSEVGEFKLLRGLDEKKDQSYFLWTLTQEKLRHILFPIGHMTKEEVRAKAKELGLPCAERLKSQGICFVGSEDIAGFLREHLPIKKGPVVDGTGGTIGDHDGVWFYTEGQRHGFRVFESDYPLYVIKKDIKKNTLVVGRGKESEVSGFTVKKVNWIDSAINNQQSTINNLEVGVRIRHLGEIMPATITPVPSHPATQSPNYLITLRAPARGVAPGQSAVFYHGEEVLGGGVIKEV